MDMHFDGVIFKTHALELERRIQRSWPPFVLIDTRPAAEYASEHIAGAVHAPVAALRTGGLPGGNPGAEFIVVGRDPEDPDIRAAALALRDAGARRIVELAGGMITWTDARYPTASAAA